MARHDTGFMTLNDFQAKVRAIEQEPFKSQARTPLDGGIERAHFKELKFKRLLCLAQGVSYATVKRKVEVWTRQLKRAQEARERMERLKKEISSNHSPPSR